MRLLNLYAGVLGTLLIALPAQAESFLYAPENCDFQIAFPSEPESTQLCLSEDMSKCDDVTRFTKVFGLDASINVKVSCYAADEGMLDRYTGDVMKYTLTHMLEEHDLENFEVDFREIEGAKHAIAVGTGTKGLSDRLFSAQLWISANSVMTIEGELVGVSGPEADGMFADILSSAGLKERLAEKAPEPAAPQDKN